MSGRPTLWCYYLPNVDGQGWAEIVLGSNGFFAAVSDYGNYAYAWRHHGKADFRLFVLGMTTGGYGDYVCSKLSREVFDVKASIESAKEAVLRRRHARPDRLGADAARDAYDAIGEVEDEFGWNKWMEDYGYTVDPDGYWELSRTDFPADIRCFVNKVVPRLQEVIREEMAAEGLAVAP